MAYQTGFVDNTGSEGVAHWQMLLTIKTFAEAHGWTTLRYLNPTPYTTDTVVRELILQGAGLSGTEQIFIGFRAYQSQSADYYNLSVAGFTGYVAASAFTSQPGYRESGLCAHNLRIDYWLAVNAQRIALAMKVGTPVYEFGYVGKFFPYGTPSQYPYPLAVIGTLVGAPATRFSDTTATHTCGVKGGAIGQGAIRDVMGNWQLFSNVPYAGSPTVRRDAGGYYKAMKCVLYNTGQVWGELDGVRYIPGFNNTVENTTTINAEAQVVIQDVFRTGIGDYFLLELN